ncbi:MAG: hypothetical protein FWG89_04060 [Treponema sp.]|nr:hypothetical protein [Treponema sp.]
MKTAISIDKKLFDNAERFSRDAGLSRSRLYCIAISEYIQNHSADNITEQLNRYYSKHKSNLDDDLRETAYRLLDGEDW